MTTENKAFLAVLTGGGALIALILSLTLHWPVWLWVPITVAYLLIPLFTGRAMVHRAKQRELRDQHQRDQAGRQQQPVVVEQAPVQTYQALIRDIPLSSAVSDYEFMLAATVYWRPVPTATAGPHANRGALAVDTIISRAQEATRLEQPGDFTQLQHRLNGTLGAIVADRSGRVDTWADQVQLTLPAADLQRLRDLADVRKKEEVWEHRRNYERNKRAYLGEDVLKTTGSAVVWWLAQRDEPDVTGTVDLIGALARLTAAANDEEVPELFQHLLPDSALPASARPHTLFTPGAFGSDGADQPPQFNFGAGPVGNGAGPGSSAIDLVNALMDLLDLDGAQRAHFPARMAAEFGAMGGNAEAEQILRHFDPEDDLSSAAADQDPAGSAAPAGDDSWPEPDSDPEPTRQPPVTEVRSGFQDDDE
ncbi:MAG TPA: hypothetical protein VHW44_28770 [Pseudonocardiaceae bacterium]|jgi:membrane protein implicated in regulation of membrane protease activity|nr:hypothetical protein [Pseudonocardiaceae bacterium]